MIEVPPGTPGAVYLYGYGGDPNEMGTGRSGWFIDPAMIPGAVYSPGSGQADMETPGGYTVTEDQLHALWLTGKSPQHVRRAQSPVWNYYEGVARDPWVPPSGQFYLIQGGTNQVAGVGMLRVPMPAALVDYLDKKIGAQWDMGLADHVYVTAPMYTGTGAAGANMQNTSSALAMYLFQFNDPNVNQYATFISSPAYLQALADDATARANASKASQWANGLKVFSLMAPLFIGLIGTAFAPAAQAGAEAASAAASESAAAVAAEGADMAVGQFELLDAGFDPGVFDAGGFDFTGGFEFDPGALDFGSFPMDDYSWLDEFSTDPFSDPSIGLDPWADTLQVDSGNFGLDVTGDTGISGVTDAAGNTYYLDGEGMIVGAEDAYGNVISVPSADAPITLPDGKALSLKEIFSYAQQGMKLYQMYEQASSDPYATSPIRRATTAPSAYRPPTRVAVDPMTGQRVNQVLDPRTGQYVPATRTDPATGQVLTFNPATGQYETAAPSWIPGIPNWAAIGGGVGLLALVMLKG